MPSRITSVTGQICFILALAACLSLLQTDLAPAPLDGLLGVSPAAAQEDADETGETPEEPQETWFDFEVPEQGFGISFPEKPTVSAKSVAGQSPLIQHDYQLDPGDGTAYHAIVFEYPEGRAPKTNTDYYERLVSAYAQGSGSKLVSQGPTKIAGLQGFEATASDGKLNHLIDIAPAGDRIYMLVSVGPRGHTKSEAAKRFRDSFHLVEKTKEEPPAEEEKPAADETEAAGDGAETQSEPADTTDDSEALDETAGEDADEETGEESNSLYDGEPDADSDAAAESDAKDSAAPSTDAAAEEPAGDTADGPADDGEEAAAPSNQEPASEPVTEATDKPDAGEAPSEEETAPAEPDDKSDEDQPDKKTAPAPSEDAPSDDGSDDAVEEQEAAAPKPEADTDTETGSIPEQPESAEPDETLDETEQYEL